MSGDRRACGGTGEGGAGLTDDFGLDATAADLWKTSPRIAIGYGAP
jgi:hypothetical protein